jgi:ubiquitin-protein ligase
MVSQIYHPNVDLEGNVCLNILREDWKPVLNLNSIMVGLQYLFLEPNADDPLNKGSPPLYPSKAKSLLTSLPRENRSSRRPPKEPRTIHQERQLFYERRVYSGVHL